MFTVESFVAFTVGNGGCARFIKEVANPACHACDFGVCLVLCNYCLKPWLLPLPYCLQYHLAFFFLSLESPTDDRFAWLPI